MADTVYNTVVKLAAEYLVEKEPFVIMHMDSDYTSLGLDSLDSVEMCLALEEQLDVETNEDRWDKCRTFNQMIDYLRELKGE